MGKPKKKIDDRFKRFGTVSFTGTTKINDFIDFLDKGVVCGTKCKDCGEIFFPPRAQCHKCMNANMEWFEVTGKGKLMAYSQLRYAPIGFGDDLPYTIAVLDYGDYKVFGRIGEIDFDDLAIGMEMTTRVNDLGDERMNYVFEKA